GPRRSFADQDWSKQPWVLSPSTNALGTVETSLRRRKYSTRATASRRDIGSWRLISKTIACVLYQVQFASPWYDGLETRGTRALAGPTQRKGFGLPLRWSRKAATAA